MASSMTYPVQALFTRGKVIAGHFDVAADGTVSGAVGAGVTPTYLASAGKFRLTFSEAHATLISAVVQYGKSAAGDQFVQLGAYNSGNKTLDINLWDISDGALANAAGTIYFIVVFQD